MISVPTYELPFEKQVHGKRVKERKGKHPSYYQLDKVCNSDTTAAQILITQLQKYENEQNTKVACLQVLDKAAPVRGINVQVPVGSIIDKLNSQIISIRKSDKCHDDKVVDVLEALKLSEEERDTIEMETKDQSGNFIWNRAREKRITASVCHRVISFTGRTSGKVLVNDVIRRKTFTTAATEFGLQHEQLAIDKYKDTRNVTVEKCGLFISLERGYLAASPDGIVTRADGEKGLLEVKALPSWTDVSVLDAYKDRKYPARMTVVNDANQRAPRLKTTHQYYHQVQLQLYCCSHFAKFVDFIILHVNRSEMHAETIYPDLEWQATKLPKLEAFYKEKIIPELLK